MTTTELKHVIRQVASELEVNEYMTPEQVASKIGVSPATVRRWCSLGTMKYSKFGRSVRIKTKDFQEYCKQNEL